MVSDEHYDLCLPILLDPSLEDEDKIDKLEELFKNETNLRGTYLDHAILDALWRFRDGGAASASPPPIRQSILRRPSPASWRGSPTPLTGSPRLGVSPLAPPGFIPSTFNRAISSTASPFSSPRASPRLALATPTMPHSPNLNVYEFASDSTPATEIHGYHQAENVEWLVNDDAASVASSSGMSSGLNAAAPEFSSMTSQQADMSPYDMLRSILGQTRTDEDIEAALAMHGYDLSATIASIMEGQGLNGAVAAAPSEEPKSVLIGKSISAGSRPATPASQARSGVICKFYISTGQCLRADCRFSHDLSSHLCKYWVMGSCLAGDTCVFSHDPSQLVNKLSLDEAGAGSVSLDHANLQLHSSKSFPSLHQQEYVGLKGGFGQVQADGPRQVAPAASPRPQALDMNAPAPAIDDNEVFPSLGSASAKQGKRHHGKRGGHGGGQKDNAPPASLAEVFKRAPSPAGGPSRAEPGRSGASPGTSTQRSGEKSAAALAIPPPKVIPWLETGERVNRAYLKSRQEAMKHGGLRNKFLQSAAQAWNRNDARAAKALSLRGQSENELMQKAHREAAAELYAKRNQVLRGIQAEFFVDLHGLHADEAVEYLEKVLLENGKEARPIYAIVGCGNHSKNGKDKIGKAIRNFLDEWRYAYNDFSQLDDRDLNGIIGIDARSWDKSLAREGEGQGNDEDMMSRGIEIGEGKVRLLVRDTPKGSDSRQ
ncbi:hypothetical protein RJ55_01431 [Drechmeria coniospora]|nr:hypothetical protein RJ55_01431 [Drechmeria coniospora]